MISDKDILKQLIEQTADATTRLPEFVEKDYYSILLLKSIISKRDDIVFKGGTCLSKCFKIINRFSEDIDISLKVEHLSFGQRKKLAHDNIEGSISDCGLLLTNSENIRSRRWFNRYLCKYNSFFTSSSITDVVILELATQSPSDLYEIKECQTFVGEYLDSIGQHELCVKFGLEKFQVKVQKLERTFVDKIYAICDYQISKKLTRNSRHIYDLHRILPLIKLDSSLVDLFAKVREYRLVNPTCFSVLGEYKLYNLLNDLINEETFKSDFNNVTKPLLYDNTQYSECLESLRAIQKFLEQNNL